MPSNVEKLPRELQVLFKDYKDTPISRSIARKFGLVIPNELKSSAEVMTWLEELKEVKLLPNAKPSDSQFRSDIVPPHRQTATAATPQPTVSLFVRMRGCEVGRSTYRSNQRAEGNLEIPRDQLEEILRDNDNDISEAATEVISLIRSRGEENLDFEDIGEVSHSEFGSEEMEDVSIDNYDDVRTLLEGILQSMLPEEDDDYDDDDGDGDDDY